ncbi:MAG TPA: YCF48-related protein [Candidatus Binataceae bacterium]|nr:YCF48-related protein [Candidatus Binataceae bacterium]
MNRGQYRRIASRKPSWLVALCASFSLCVLSGIALGAAGQQKATAQPHRAWENYFGATILPSGRAIVVGDKGLVMISDDHGRTWTRQLLKSGDVNYDLYSATFSADGSRGWAVGDHSVIFRTDDHGTSWTEQKAPAGATDALLKVAVADPQTACASGEHGAMVCTSDGGATWTMQKFHDLCIFDLAFTDPHEGWAVGEFSAVLHTTDAGKTWKLESGGNVMGKDDPFFAIAFHHGHDGLAVGLTGSSISTANGGGNWKPGKVSIDNRSLYAVAPLPDKPDTFYVAGENGVAGLIDNGQVSQVHSGTSEAISSVAFAPQFGIAVGLSGTLLRSTDGGQHWQSLNNADLALQTPGQ